MNPASTSCRAASAQQWNGVGARSMNAAHSEASGYGTDGACPLVPMEARSESLVEEGAEALS